MLLYEALINRKFRSHRRYDNPCALCFIKVSPFIDSKWITSECLFLVPKITGGIVIVFFFA